MKKLLALLLCLMLALPSGLVAQADINLPAALTVVGAEAFKGDSSITGLVQISDNVTRIQSGAFANTNLTGIDLSSSVRYVESGIIDGSPVTYVIVRRSDVQLADDAFAGASVIVSGVGSTAQAWAEAHGVEWYPLAPAKFVLHNGFYYHLPGDGTAKLMFAKDSDAVSGSIKLPVSISGTTLTEISEYAFTRCSGLSAVSVPDTVSELSSGDNWPSLSISTYATGADPVLPEEEYVELEMPESLVILPVGYSDYWLGGPEEAPEGVWLWYSSDDNIVSVGQNGRLIANNAGTAAATLIIRAEDAVYAGVTNVTVVEPEASFTLANLEGPMVAGQTFMPSYRVITNFGLTYMIRNAIVATSDNEDALVVNEDGTITAVAAGKANLHIESSYMDYTFTADIPVTVRASELALNRFSIYTYTGLQEQLAILCDLPEGTTVEWRSDDEEFVIVDETGLITAVGDGQTYVHCDITYPDGTAETLTCYVYSEDRDPYIGVHEEPIYFFAGQSGSVDELPFYMDFMWWWFEQEHDIRLEYESSDESVLSFENGMYHAHKEGEVTITVDGAWENVTASSEFTCKVYEPDSYIWINEEPVEIDMMDTGFRLDYDFGSVLGITGYNFTSSDPKVVEVTADGFLLPVGPGTAEVTLTAFTGGEDLTASVEVTVRNNGFSMDSDYAMINKGETLTLISSPEIPEGLSIMDNVWASDNNDIARFEDSVVYGFGVGTTTVWHDMRLSDDSWISARTVITVVDPEAPITLNANQITLGMGDSYQLEAAFDGEPDDVEWFSDDEFVSVDENGLVTMVDTWEPGRVISVYCVATYGDEEYSAVCTVFTAPMNYRIDWFPGDLELSTGDEHQIEFIVNNAGDFETRYEWSTEDESVATIDENGVMTAHATGTTGYGLTIYDAEDEIQLARATGIVYVNVAPEAPEAVEFGRNGYLLTMSDCTEDYAGADIISDRGWDYSLLRYSSSNKEVVTIDEDGNIAAVNPGLAEITVTMVGYPELKDTATVVVMESIEMTVTPNEEVLVGDIINVRLPDIPEEADLRIQLSVDYDRDLFHLWEDTDTGLYLKCIRPGETWISGIVRIFDENIDNPEEVEYFDYELCIGVPEYHLNESLMYLSAGDQYELWPEFEYDGENSEIVWSSSNDEVATVNQDGVVTAVSERWDSCTISFTCIDPEGNEITASCEVTVANPFGWELAEITIPDYLVLGRVYGLDEYVETDSWVWPEPHWTASDPEMIEFDYENDCFTALQTGTVTLTCTATKDGESQTLSKAVTIIDLPLRMAEDYVVELRPGQTKQLSVIAGQGKEIEFIEWMSNSAAVSVDQEGSITAMDEDGEALIYATATFTDGSTATAICRIWIVNNDEVWMHVEDLPEEIELSINDVNYPTAENITLDFHTNTDLDELSINWVSHDEDIVKISGIESDYYNNADNRYTAATIEAVGEGETWVEVQIINEELGIESSRSMRVRVYNPHFEIVPNETHYTIKTGESRGLNYWTDEGEGYGHVSLRTFSSSDESVVRVFEHDSVIGVAPGTATVTATYYCGDEVLDSQEFYFTVEGVTLSDTSLTLNKGESHILTPSLTTTDNYGGWSWDSSNPEVAVVSIEGLVVATGAGSATITYRANLGDGDATTTCVVTVPATDEPFYMKESYVTVPGDMSAQLEHVSTIGEPDDVEWTLSDDGLGEISKTGLLTPYWGPDERILTVTCTATFGDEVYTAYCNVLVIPQAVCLVDMEGLECMSVGDTFDKWIWRTMREDVEYTIEVVSDNPEVAVGEFDENNDSVVVISAVGKGVANLRCVMHASDGFTYYSGTCTVYVDTPFPELTEFGTEVDTLVLFAPETERFSDRHIPWYSLPEGTPVDVRFASDNTDIVTVNDEGWVEAVAPGTANINITLPDYPDFNMVLPVVVIGDASVQITGLENGIRSGEQIQLGIESADNWHEYASGIEYINYYPDDQVILTEDGLLYAREPYNEDGYAFWVNFYFGSDREEAFKFTFDIDRDEDYIYAWHPDYEMMVYPGQEFWPDTRSSFDVHGWVVTSEDEGTVAVAENGDHWIGVQPGVATVTYQAIMEDGSLFPTVLTNEVTVLEPEDFLTSVDTMRVISVGETWDVYGHVEPHHYNGPDIYYESSDSEILRVEARGEDWDGQDRITGVAPGMAYLTLHAAYGDTVSTETISIYVVDETPAYLNAYDFSMRPGRTAQLIVTPIEGKTIESIEWVSSNPNAISVDENGLLTAGEEGHVQILVHITFTDGTHYTHTVKVGITTDDDDLWLDFHGREDDRELTLDDRFGYETTTTVSAFFSSSLAEDEISVTWSVEDDSIVRIDNSGLQLNNNEPCAYQGWAELTAVGEGWTSVTVTITSEFGHHEEHTFGVRVYNPHFEIITDEPEYTIQVGESRGLNFYYEESEGLGMRSAHLYKSSDENVVRVNASGQIQGIAPGAATVTHSVCIEGNLIASQEFYVTVSDIGAVLNTSELSLELGESAQLIPTVTGIDNYNSYEWQTSDSNVAIVSNDGKVVAVGGGTATISYFVHCHGSLHSATCRVSVPMTDEEFYLADTSLELVAGESHQFEYVSTIGEPDSIEWTVSDHNHSYIEESGLFVSHEFDHEDQRVTVTATATFGNEVHTASCDVMLVTPKVRLEGSIGGYHSMRVGDVDGMHAWYAASESAVGEIEVVSGDPSIVNAYFENDFVINLEAISKGVTTVRYIVHGTDGHTYERSMHVYVDTAFPEIDEFFVDMEALLLFAPGSDWLTSRYVHWHTEPDGYPVSVEFSSDNTDVVVVHDDGWVEAVGPGTANIIITLPDYPDMSTSLPVYVAANTDFGVTGLQNVYNAGDTVQLGIDCEWPEDAYTARFYSNNGDEQYHLTEDGLLHVVEPGDYSFRVEIESYGECYEREFSFSVQRDEEYITPFHAFIEVHPNEEFWPDVRTNVNIRDWSWQLSSDDENIVAVSEDGFHWVGVNPGTTTVTYQAILEDGSIHPIVCTSPVIVLEPEAPDAAIRTQRVIHVGESVGLDIDVQNWTFNGPDYYFECENPEILEVNSDGRWMRGIAPGVAYVTMRASYGDMTSTDRIAIHVVEGGYAEMSTGELELRSGYAKQLFVHPAEGCTIESIEWSSSCPDLIQVDENGVVTAFHPEGNAMIMAYVTFDDGSTTTVSARAYVARDEDLWLDLHGWDERITLGLNENYGPAQSSDSYLRFNTNLAYDELTVEWHVDDESIVRIDETSLVSDPEDYNGYSFWSSAKLVAVSEGTTSVHAFITNDYGLFEERYIEIEVTNPSVTIEAESSDLTIYTGEVSGINTWINTSGDYGVDTSRTWSSSDADIVEVNHDGQMFAVAPGEATVTLSVYSDNHRLMDSHDFNVTVLGGELSETEITLNKGEIFALTPVLPEDMEYESTGWYSDDLSVASVSSNGCVMAVGAGFTTVYFTFDAGDHHYEIPCRVHVPYSDEDFRLNTSYVELFSGDIYQLEYISEVEPDHVEWSTDNDYHATVDENGLVTYQRSIDYYQINITCTATFGDEVRTATCAIRPASVSSVWLQDLPNWKPISIDEERFLGAYYCVVGDVDVEFELTSDDPSIAELVMHDNGHLNVRGNGQGVTNVHFTVRASDGHSATSSMTVYVNSDAPAVESIGFSANPVVLQNLGAGEFDRRWILIEHDPNANCNATYSSEDTDVITCYENGWIEAVAPGRATVNVTIHNNPTLSTTVDIIVLDSEPAITGLENNTMQAGSQVQLHLDGGDIWSEDELNVRYYSNYDGNHFEVTEYGLIKAYEPGDYSVWIEIQNGDCSFAYEYFFTVERPEEYFYTRLSEVVMYEGQTYGCDVLENLGLNSVSSETDNADVLNCHDDLYTAIAPGNANVYFTGHYDDGSTAPCQNSVYVTVLEAIEPNFDVYIPNWLLHVDESVPVYINSSDQSTFGPDYYCTSSNDSILRIEDGSVIVGVAPGEVTLTVTAFYGHAESSKDFTIRVID